MNIAIKTYLYRNRDTIYFSILTTACIFSCCGYGAFKKFQHQDNRFFNVSVVTLGITLSVCVAVGILLMAILIQGKKVGITQSDLNDLQKTPINFVAAHQDAFCQMQYLEEMTKNKSNVAITKVDTKDKASTKFIDAINVHNNFTLQDAHVIPALEKCATRLQ